MKKKTGFLICILAICMLCLSFCGNTYAAATKTSIRLNKSKVTVYTPGNKTVQLKATVKGASKKVTWKSSNKKVAVVNSGGKVTVKKAGSVTITAKSNGMAAQCKIIIHKKNNVASLYKSFLEKKYTYINSTIVYGAPRTKLSMDYFCIADINKDGIDDLLIREMDSIGNSQFMGISLHIFTVKDGKIKYSGSWLHGTSEINKKYGGIRVTHSGTGYGGDSLISLKNGKCYKKIYLYGHEDSNQIWHYFLNNENNEITKQKYDRYRIKYFDTQSDIQTITFLINNVANREKIK